MEGMIAIIGFWVFVIALVMKKPLMAYLDKDKSRTQLSQEVNELSQRVQQLESLLSTSANQFLELKESTENTQRLLIESARRMDEAQQVFLETSQQNSVLIEDLQQRSPKLIEAHLPESSFGVVVNDNTVRFERTLPGHIEEVWKYFTQPTFLSRWLAEATVEARLGGRIELSFDEAEMPERKEKGKRIIGLINGFEPLRKLAFSWMDTSNDLDSAVSVELSEQGDKTNVVLTHTRLPRSRMHEFLAGWHTHLDVLAARLTNSIPPIFSKRFNQVVQKYAAIVASTVVVSGASGVSLPSQAASGLDEASYQTIKTERSDLMKKYDLLWRDVDEQQRRISSLKKEDSIDAQRQVDQLDRQLENDYRDLHDIELRIKDLDKVLN